MSPEPGAAATPEPARGPGPLIETVTTTRDPDGAVNCAAMGVRFAGEEVTLWPFHDTRTLRNLRAHGQAVVHRTDDILLFAQAALGRPTPATRPAWAVDGAIIEDAGAWHEIVVTEIAPSADGLPRSQVRARIVAGGPGETPPLGLCRAHHAVLEATILASRLRRIGASHVRGELDRLQELVDKTGGDRERAAMDYVRAFVSSRAGAPAS